MARLNDARQFHVALTINGERTAAGFVDLLGAHEAASVTDRKATRSK